MALAPGLRFGSEFNALTAASHAEALRDVMYTLEAPACRNLRHEQTVESQLGRSNEQINFTVTRIVRALGGS